MKKLITFLLIFFMFVPLVHASEDLAPNSKSAILIEATTGEILFQKNVNEKLAPASMTNVMDTSLLPKETRYENKR